MKSNKTKPEEVPMSPALTCIQAAYDAMPYGNSRERYRNGMFAILRTAIVSGMRFAPEDFAKMKNPASWVGAEGDEGLYALACGSDRNTENISAAIAMEKWFERPAVIWAEKAKTPTRLYVGAKFTWDGRVVTITSMRDDSLVACTYSDSGISNRERADVGTYDYFDAAYRKVLQRKDAENGSVFVEFGPADKNVSHSGTIEKRYTVKYADLAAARKDYDKRRRDFEKRVEATTTLAELDAIAAEATAQGRAAYRHFDIEILRDAIAAARKRIRENMTAEDAELERQRAAEAEAEDIKRWLRGEDVHRHFNELRVRVVDDYVETTTGQRATVASVKLLIPFVKKFRHKGWVRSDADAPSADLHPLKRIDVEEGVTIGCTLFPWEEVYRCIEAIRNMR